MIDTDGSENVKNAVGWGIGLARTYNAELSAIYVIPPSGVALAMRGEMWSKALTVHLRDEGRKATEYVVDTGKREGVEVKPVIIEDKTPTDGIVDFARENTIDLIVMGTLGKTGLSQILLGSVAENVVRHSKRQVLTVP